MRSQGLVSSCSRRVGLWEGPRGGGGGAGAATHPPSTVLCMVSCESERPFG